MAYKIIYNGTEYTVGYTNQTFTVKDSATTYKVVPTIDLSPYLLRSEYTGVTTTVYGANGLTANGSTVLLGGVLTGSTVLVDNRVTKKGVEYGGNYSTGFTNLSLVTKQYVTGLTNSLITTAANGLTKSGSVFKLGGALTGSTVLNGGWTATTNSEATVIVNPILTSRNTNSDKAYGIMLTPTLKGNSGLPTGQIMYGVNINPTFTGSSVAQVNSITKYPFRLGINGNELLTVKHDYYSEGMNGQAQTYFTFTNNGTRARVGINTEPAGAVVQIQGIGGAGYVSVADPDTGSVFSIGAGGAFSVGRGFANNALTFVGLTNTFRRNANLTSISAAELVGFDFTQIGALAFPASLNIPTERHTYFRSQTLSTLSGTGTIGEAFGVFIDKSTAGSGMSIGRNWALGLSGDTKLIGNINISGTSNLVGLARYTSDLSSSFVPRSLVDKGYVTGLTSVIQNNYVTGATSLGGTTLVGTKSGKNLQFKGLVAGSNITLTPSSTGITITSTGGGTGSTVTANNGLNKVGNNIRLGGALTGNTTIDAGTGFTLTLNAQTQGTGIITGKIGTTSNVSLLSFKNQTANQLTAGFTDVYLGAGNGSGSNGAGNIAVGNYNLRSITASASEFNGGRNIAIGYDNQTGMTTGTHNVSIGRKVGNVKSGNPSYAIDIGYEVQSNAVSTANDQHIAIGVWPMQNFTGLTGTLNTIAIGYRAMADAINRTSSSSLAIGTNALAGADFQGGNIAIGSNAGNGSKIAASNVLIGPSAGINMTGSSASFCVGIGTLTFQNGNGQKSTFVGTEAGSTLVRGNANSGFGNWALPYTTGNYNTGLGAFAGFAPLKLTGSTNTFIGYNSTYSNAGLNSTIAIGVSVTASTSNRIYLGGPSQSTILGLVNSGTTSNILVKESNGEIKYRTSTDFTNPLLTKAAFNTYSGATATSISNRLLTSAFNTYSGATATNIGNRLLTSAFNTYSGATATAIGNRLLTSSFNTYSGATASRISVIESNYITGATSLGGATLVGTKSGKNQQFKGLVAGANITLTPSSTGITISTGGGVGEANTASNLGSGVRLFKQKSGVDLQFRSLSGGTGIVISSADTVTISTTGLLSTSSFNTYSGATASRIAAIEASEAVDVTGATSLGNLTILGTKSGKNLQFKGLAAGSNVTLTPSSTGITISCTGVNANGYTFTGVTSVPTGLTSNQLRLFAEKTSGKITPRWQDTNGFDYGIAPAPYAVNQIWWSQTTATAGLWIGTAGAGAGTFTNTLPTTTNKYTAMKRAKYANVVTTTNQQVGQRSSENMFFRGAAANQGGFFFMCRFGLDAWTSGSRIFVGLHTGTTAVVTVEPATLKNIVGFAVQASGSSIQFIHNDNSGNAVKDTINGTTLTANQGYDAYIYCKPNDSTIYYRLDDLNAGTTLIDTSTSTDLPVNTAMMAAFAIASNGANTAAGAVAIGVNKIYLETNY